MNWNAVSAISEIVGALVVIVTLLFIAREVRQNNRSLAMAALRDSTSRWNQWSEMIATSPDLADVVARGNRNFEQLSEAESLRYGAYVQSFFDNVESYRSMVVDLDLERDIEVLEAIVRRRIIVPGFEKWWTDNTDDYDVQFVAWIDRVRSTADAGD